MEYFLHILTIMILKSFFQGENRRTNLQIYVLIEDLLLELKNPRNWVNQNLLFLPK